MPLNVFAQIVVSGRVLEAKDTPLSFANVRLLTATGKLQGGQATDQKGNFRIANLPAGTYVLEVSYVGYKTYSEKLTLSVSNNVLKMKDIILKEDGELSEVMVVGKATEVTMKGDTIEYNAGSFTTSEGAALQELVKKLPGASVDDNGNVTVNGKSISQIMVDGKRFFESDPKVALKNLPADLVDKVQVLDRESDNSRMTGFSDGETETILNLTIKPGRKTGIFGTAYAGAGTKGRYEGNAMINRFVEGKQWTILGGLNNTNNASFSDIASDLSRSDLAQQASGSSRRPWQRNNGNDGITISRMLGGNIVMTIGSKLEAGANAFVGNSDKTMEVKSETTNIESNGTTQENASSTEHNNKWNVGTNMRFEWKPDNKTEIIFTPQLSFGTGRGYLGSYTSTDYIAMGATAVSRNTTNSITQDTESRVYSTGFDLDMSRRLSDKGRTLALSLEGNFTGNKIWGTYIANTTGATANSINQNLTNDEFGNSLRARLNYVEPLGQGFALQLNYQIRSQQSEGERLAHDNITNTLSSNGSYTLESSFISHRAGIAIKKATNSLDVTLGLNVDPSRLRSTTTRGAISRDIVQNVTNFSPTFRLSYKPTKAFTIRLDYRGRSFQPSVNQLAPINDGTNPLVVYQGNPDLLPGFRHDLMGMMSIFSSAKQSSLMLFTNANITENNIVSKSEYDAATGVRTTSYTNVNGNWSVGLGGFFTTPLPGKKFSLRLGSRNNYSNSVGFVGAERNDARVWSLGEDITLAYRYGMLDTSIKGEWSYNKVTNTLDTATPSATNNYGIHWDTNLTLPLNLSFESQVRYNTTSGYASGYNYDQTLVNLGLSFSFLSGRAATLRLKVYDVLGQQRNVFRSVSALSVSSQETNIIGRYAMLHFIYKFNSFTGNATAEDMKSSRRGGPGGPPPGRF